MIEDAGEFRRVFHRLLLGLGGRLDESATTVLYEWIYVGEEGQAVRSLVGNIRAAAVPVTEAELADIRALAWFLNWRPEIFPIIDALPRAAAVPESTWTFEPGPAEPDELEQRAVDLARTAIPTALLLRRTLRVGAGGEPYRLLLAEAVPDADLMEIAGRLVHRLDLVLQKRTSAQAVHPDLVLPAYYRSAFAGSTVLWMR